MKKSRCYQYRYKITGLTGLPLLNILFAVAQESLIDSSPYYNRVQTYINPVLHCDHPDPTLLKAGDDFYPGPGFK
jgi:hypothetical protein